MIDFRLRFDLDAVGHWADRYTDQQGPKERESERELVEELAPAVRDCGYYDKRALEQFAHWKSPRIVHQIEKNGMQFVQEISRLALFPQMSVRESKCRRCCAASRIPCRRFCCTLPSPTATQFWTLERCGRSACSRPSITFNSGMTMRAAAAAWPGRPGFLFGLSTGRCGSSPRNIRTTRTCRLRTGPCQPRGTCRPSRKAWSLRSLRSGRGGIGCGCGRTPLWARSMTPAATRSPSMATSTL